MATLEEQETVITQNRADDYVSIWSSNTHDIAHFNGRDEFELVQEWRNEDGELEAASWRLPRDRANIRKLVKAQRGPMSAERVAAMQAGRERARNADSAS